MASNLSPVERISGAVTDALTRRRFLRGVSSAGLATAGAVTGWALLGQSAAAAAPAHVMSGDARLRPDANVIPDLCHVYCNVADCCNNTCCDGAYDLFKCTNSCDGSYFYVCAKGCNGFCYSLGC